MKVLAVFAALAAVAVAGPFASYWTLDEISMALQNPDTHPSQIPYLEEALNNMMHALMAGEQVGTVALTLPLVHTYTLQELSNIIEDPTTNPDHLHYYEDALNEHMHALHAGETQELITVVIFPTEDKPEEPVGTEVAPAPVEAPTAPAAPAAASPLVQIIVNVQKQEQEAGASPALVDFEDAGHVFYPEDARM